MQLTEQIFLRKTPNTEKLLVYGFQSTAQGFAFETALEHSGFSLRVTVSEDGVAADVTDPDTALPYTLFLSDDAVGSFVGAVRHDVEMALLDIAARCFDPDVFKTAQAKRLIAHVQTAYGDAPEYLWEKFPDNAVFRRSDNQKWYAALLTVSKRKLGLPSDERAEILDLRAVPEEIPQLLNRTTFFPGWHMNKKHWYTILLDGGVADAVLFDRLAESYRLAGNK